MLVIRTEQLQHFDRVLQARYLNRACLYLREQLSDAVAEESDAALREHAAAALQRALGYGLRTQDEHLGYLAIAAALGWNFHEERRYQWIGECLGNRLLGAPAVRLDSVLHALENDAAGSEGGEDDA